MKQNNRYVFYSSDEGIGGVQLLFSRLAKKLILDNKNVIILSKNPKNYISNYLRKDNLTFEKIIINHKYNARDNDIIILVLSLIGKYENIIKPNNNTRFLFWDIHPYNLIENTAFSFFYKKKSKISPIFKYIEKTHFLSIRRFVEIATFNKGLVFMCNLNYLKNYDYFKFNINPIFLPIPITSKFGINDNNSTVSKCNSISIGWISRLDSDKLEALYLLIIDITQYNDENKNSPIILHIIGNGEYEEQLRIKYQNNKNLVFTGRLDGYNLSNYIDDNIDIGFSMGTSALEFAYRKKATILVPDTTETLYFNSIPRKYIWLYDSYGGDVSVCSYYHTEKKTKSLFEILKEYQKNTKECNDKCYNHAMKYHNIDSIYSKFLKFCTESTLTHFDIKKSKINGVFTLSYVFIILKKIYKSFF